MRRLLLGSAALTAMSVAAFAADLPARGPAVAPAPVYVAPIFTWTGFYVGLNAGVGFNSGNDRGVRAYSVNGQYQNEVDNLNDALASVNRDSSNAGFTGGAQIGYNWQFGAMVLGLEADINYLDRNNGSRNYTIAGFDTLQYGAYDIDVQGSRGGGNWFGTIRPRIGVAFDRTMIYATGGLAYAGSHNGNASVTVYQENTNNELARWEGRRSGSNWGWTLGAGIEHAFSNNFSLKLEYLYVNLDRGGNNDLVATGPNRLNVDNIVFRGGRSDDNFHVIRAGLNWRFGGPAYAASGPVVARY
ncbi:MAG: outer membrane beta-barrel protein [Beijerinckiaceae bacterium]|nr:outer membrane beta-barrel protein [Beijerinckiaceae bacterium]